jgi:hypothetical protein
METGSESINSTYLAYNIVEQKLIDNIISDHIKRLPLYSGTVYFSRYKGRMYDRCVTHAYLGVPWCATATDSLTSEMIPGNRASCLSINKVNDCPVGFTWAYSEATCYRVSL